MNTLYTNNWLQQVEILSIYNMCTIESNDNCDQFHGWQILINGGADYSEF